MRYRSYSMKRCASEDSSTAPEITPRRDWTWRCAADNVIRYRPIRAQFRSSGQICSRKVRPARETKYSYDPRRHGAMVIERTWAARPYRDRRRLRVSRYHLAHAFGAATGLSVMQYVRARRLTVAARTLADGAPDILDLALDAGYGSHEAFSRAFRSQFGVTPGMVRRQASTEDLPMTKAMNIPDGSALNWNRRATFPVSRCWWSESPSVTRSTRPSILRRSGRNS